MDVTTLVTQRADMTTEKQLNSVTIVAMPPWKIVLVRAFRVYLMALVGLLGTAGIGVTASVGISLGAAVTMLKVIGICMIISLGPAIVSAAWNTIELLKKWDATAPQMRA